MSSSIRYSSMLIIVVAVVLIAIVPGVLAASIAPASGTPSTPQSASPASVPPTADSAVPDEVTTEEQKFDEEFGHFGITLGFEYTLAQTPESQLLYQHAFGGLGEISYGIRTGLRILAGGGYDFNSPHVSPPQSGIAKGPTSDYTEGYLGVRLAMNPFFPSLFAQQPWVPYIRGDVGGVSTGVSNDGDLNGRTSGFLGDLGVGVEGRAPEFPVGFFAEVRSQWLFLGPRIINVVPVMTGTTIYF
ncbi:MAG: hypothetical protein ACYCRD_01215 [Leptospirillum sp.]